MAIQITPWGFDSSQLEALGRVREAEAVVDRLNPGEGLTGGEGEVGENGVEAEAILWMLLGCEMRARGGRSTASGGRLSSEHGGGVVPVGFGRGEGDGKLR